MAAVGHSVHLLRMGMRWHGSFASINGRMRKLSARSEGPLPDSCTAANDVQSLFDHLVGEGEELGGIWKPSAFAVVRLMTKSNLVGCSTGKSAGFAPRRILST